jgi:hypothetical protein
MEAFLERVFAREGLPAALVAFLSREFAERLTEFYGPADRQTPSILRDVHVAAMAILQAPWVHAPMLCCNPDDVTKAFKAQLVEKPGSLAEGRANESQQIYVSLIENVVNILREAGPDDAGGWLVPAKPTRRLTGSFRLAQRSWPDCR